MSEQVYITSIDILNVGGIERFRSSVGQSCIIIGANGAGKTSLLSAVSSVFEGGHDPDMLRNGYGKGEITLELSNGATIKKTITPKESVLEVRTAEGGIVKGPKTYLEKMAPGLSFDPMAFLDADPKERAAFLLKTLPLTFDASEVNLAAGAPRVSGVITLQKLNEIREGIYEERRLLNVQARDLEGTIKDMERSLPGDDGADWAAVAAALQADISKIEADIQSKALEIKIEADRERSGKTQEIEQKIAELKAELADYLRKVDQAESEAIATQAEILANQKAVLSVELGTARANADAAQRATGIRQAIADRREKLAGHISKEIRLSTALKDLDALKHRKLKELPIEGLDLKQDAKGRPVILIDEVPLDKINRQGQLFLAMQLVQFASGSLPLILCEVAEIDDANLAELADTTKKAGIQLMVARWVNGEPLRVVDAEEYQQLVA